MALSDKNIVITPNTGSPTSDPQVAFTGGSAGAMGQILLKVYPIIGGTLSFEGSAGQLFSISNDMGVLDPTIYSVSDVSGIPSLEILANGLIKLGEFGGNVLLGTGTDNGGKLQVSGAVKATSYDAIAAGALAIGGSVATSLNIGKASLPTNILGIISSDLTLAQAANLRFANNQTIDDNGSSGLAVAVPTAGANLDFTVTATGQYNFNGGLLNAPANILVKNGTNALLRLNRNGAWATAATQIQFETDSAGTDYWKFGMQANSTNNMYLNYNASTFISVTTAGVVNAPTQLQEAGSRVWTAATFDPTLKAPLASPTFTGTPASTTAAADTNSTQIATTAFVVGQASGSNPAMNGTVAVGTSLRYARADHVHPSDTSRMAVATGLTANASGWDASAASTVDVNGSLLRIGDMNSAATQTNGLGIKFMDQGSAHASIKWVPATSILSFGVSSGSNYLGIDVGTGSTMDLNLGTKAVTIGGTLTISGGLADDTSHANRGGGSLHAAVVAGGASGFMTGADKSKLDGIASSAIASVLADAPLTGSGTSASHLTIAAATTSVNGYLTSTDWNTFNNKLSAVVANAPLSGSGTSGSHLLISQANGSTDGYLSAGDWTTFNNKLGSVPIATATILGGVKGFTNLTVDGAGALSITGANVNAALGYTASRSATSTNSIYCPDTRNTNSIPQDTAAGLYIDFRANATDSLSDGGTYHAAITIRQYGSGSDFSGGVAHMLAVTDAGNLWHRYSSSATTWTAWVKVCQEGTSPTFTGVTAPLYTAAAGVTAVLKGSAADGASAVGVIIDNANTLANAAAKLVSFRNNGSANEVAYITYFGDFYNVPPAATAGATLKNSSIDALQGSYWNGTSSTIYTIGCQTVVTATAPTAKLSIQFQGSERAQIWNDGSQGILGSSTGGNITAGLYLDGSGNLTFKDGVAGSKTLASMATPTYLQATGLSTSWGTTSGTSTGAVNAIMGTGASATWMLSGSSGGTFRYGIQGLDAGGAIRIYVGSEYLNFSSAGVLSAGATALSLTVSTITGAVGASATWLTFNGSGAGAGYVNIIDPQIGGQTAGLAPLRITRGASQDRYWSIYAADSGGTSREGLRVDVDGSVKALSVFDIIAAGQLNVGTSVATSVVVGSATITSIIGGATVASTTSVNGATWPAIPVVKSTGIVDIGRYIDFHNSSNDGTDYAVRLETNNTTTGLTINGSQVMTAGNVATYALPIGGGNLTGAMTVPSWMAITQVSTEQRLLMGNQDSGGTNTPFIFRVANAQLTLGVGNSWATNGGTLTSYVTVTSSGLNVATGTLQEAGSRAWTAATLTNVSQLSNNSGYLVNNTVGTASFGAPIGGSWLGYPSIAAMCYAKKHIQDYLAFNAPNTTEEQASVGSGTWNTVSVPTGLFVGDSGPGMPSGYNLANGKGGVRFTWSAMPYYFFEYLYSVLSTNGNNVSIKAETSANGSAWSTVFDTYAQYGTYINTWPGYGGWRFAFNTNNTPYVRLTFYLNSWANGNAVNFTQISWYGDYYRNEVRTLTWDYNRNLYTAAGLVVGSTTSHLVTSYGGFTGSASANIGGTGAAAYFPNGFATGGSQNWIFATGSTNFTGTLMDNSSRWKITPVGLSFFSGPANTDQMTLGTAGGTLGILGNNYLYGMYVGVANDGHVWMQVGRNDSNNATYPLWINPGGGAVVINGATVSSTSSANGPTWASIPVVKTDGVMEVGRYIDFHNSSNDGVDYAIRLDTNGGTSGLYINGSLVMTAGNIPTYAIVAMAMNGGYVYSTVDFNTLNTVHETKFCQSNSTNGPGYSGMGYYFGMGGGDTSSRGFQLLGTSEPNFYFREISVGGWKKLYHSGMTAFELNRTGTATCGISWYSSSYNTWFDYMASSGASQGPHGNITAPAGAYVTSWARRSVIENTTAYGWTWESGANSGTTPSVVMECRASDGLLHTYGAIIANGDITANNSDRRLKTNLRPIECAVDKVMALSGYIFDWDEAACHNIRWEPTHGYLNDVGVIAQEVELVLPEAVKPAPVNHDYKTVRYDKLTALLIQAVKEQQNQILALKVELAKLIKASA